MSDDRPGSIGIRKKLLFSAIVVVAFFGLLELGFRGLELVKPPRHVDYGLGFESESRVFVASRLYPGRMETHPAKRVSFPRQRFDHPKPPTTFRIFALGGSSVHFLQGELQQLAAALTNDFQNDFDEIEIINCGGFAYGSHRLVLVFREVLEYEPDLVLLYSGHNEFEEVEQLQLSNLNRLTFDRAISNSALVRFIRDRKAEYEISQLEKEHNQRMLKQAEPVSDSNFARAWNHPFTQQDVTERMQGYEHNLRLILSAAREQQIPVVMGTVPSNLLRPYIPRQSASRYEEVYKLWKNEQIDEGVALAKQILVETPGRHQSSDLENDILRKLAEKFSVPLVDVEQLVTVEEPHRILGEKMFDDHCHLSKEGRAVWITGYEPEIRKVIDSSREVAGHRRGDSS